MEIFARKVNNYDLYANHAWFLPGWGGMFALLAWFLVGNLLGGVIMMIATFFVPQSIIDNYFMLVIYPMSFMPPMIYAARKSQNNSLFEPGYKLNSSNWGPFNGYTIALLTLAVSVATMIAADLPNYLNYKVTEEVPFLKEQYDKVMALLQQMTGGPLWSSFLLTAVFAPIFEEWLCRGMVLRGMLTRLKPGWAIVVSALFFALIHFNPWQALNAFIIGVVMGYVYYKTGSLLLTMLMHFVNNASAVILSQIPSLSEYDYWIDMMGRETYVVVYVVGVVALAACIWAFSRIPLQSKMGNMDPVNTQE